MGDDLEQALKGKTLDDIIHALPCSHPIQEEIDRLKAKLEEAHTELAISIKERIDLGNQLAEARAEVERFKYMAQQNSTEMCEWMEKYNKLVVPIECYNQMLNDEIMEHKQELTKARQEAAREILADLQKCFFAVDFEVVRDNIKHKFGLEG